MAAAEAALAAARWRASRCCRLWKDELAREVIYGVSLPMRSVPWSHDPFLPARHQPPVASSSVAPAADALAVGFADKLPQRAVDAFVGSFLLASRPAALVLSRGKGRNPTKYHQIYLRGRGDKPTPNATKPIAHATRYMY